MYYLSGLPRSGSTLLGTLLSQRPDTYVSATSGLIDLMGAVAVTFEQGPMPTGSLEDLYPILGAVLSAKYAGRKEPIIIDKSRGWPAPNIMRTMERVQGQKTKIIATVRPIAECIVSFMRISNFSGSPKEFIETSPLVQHLFTSYYTLKEGWESAPDNFLFVQYSHLLADPQKECDRVATFLGIDLFSHTFVGLSNPVPEKDEEVWGIPSLHYVRPIIKQEVYNVRAILGEKLFNFYQHGEFWNGPDPILEKTPMDLQLEAGIRGDFKLGEQLAEYADPEDDRAQFNRGWYLLRQGKLLEGMKAMNRGYEEGVFGNKCPSTMPLWTGQPLAGKTVILFLEGGLGDQIYGVRYANTLKNRGAETVVVSGSPELAEILHVVSGVDAFIVHEAIGGCYHDYYLPSMRSIPSFGIEYKEVEGNSYISIDRKKPSKQFRVGIRWAGNQDFQHDLHRRFDPSPLFNLKDCQLVNLQEGIRDIPHHIQVPSLATWEDTRKVISSLDLVITSCTSIAHLSGAMGIPTWIIVPILPYYLWALPGDTTPWYRSVRLYRQEKYGDWDIPMDRIKLDLSLLIITTKVI